MNKKNKQSYVNNATADCAPGRMSEVESGSVESVPGMIALGSLVPLTLIPSIANCRFFCSTIGMIGPY